MSLRLRLLLAVVLLTVNCSSLLAGITIPGGLNPGDKFRVAFITSTVSDATSLIIGDYDAFVTQAATSAGLTDFNGATVIWHAIGSTATTSAFDQVNSFGDSAIYRTDGSRIAVNTADLFDGTLLEATLTLDENGMVGPNRGAHTGSQFNGLAHPGFSLGDTNVIWGHAFTLDFTWLVAGYVPPTTKLNFYAISSEMTVAAVPEPTSLIVWSVIALMGGCVAFRRRKAA